MPESPLNESSFICGAAVNCGCSWATVVVGSRVQRGSNRFKEFFWFKGSAYSPGGIRLADQLRMSGAKDLARDRDYCEQTADAAASAPRNIAEGFGRFAPIQFANFLRIAIGSELETKTQILKAWQRGAITDEEHWAGMVLCKRAIGAAVGLRRYQLTQEAKANAKRIESNVERRTK